MNNYEEQLTALIMQIDSYLAMQNEDQTLMTSEQSNSEVKLQELSQQQSP